MSMKSAYTLTRARNTLELLLDCYDALVSGQAKSYRVGTREYTAYDLDAISDEITKFSNLIEVLEGSAKSAGAHMFVPRDL